MRHSREAVEARDSAVGRSQLNCVWQCACEGCGKIHTASMLLPSTYTISPPFCWHSDVMAYEMLPLNADAVQMGAMRQSAMDHHDEVARLFALQDRARAYMLEVNW